MARVRALLALCGPGWALASSSSSASLRGSAGGAGPAGSATAVGPALKFQCQTSLDLGPVSDASWKGIAIDDETLQFCAGSIPHFFPNTQEPVKSLRLFKPWDPEWSEEGREAAWDGLVAYAKGNDAKVLLGTSVSCNATLDSQMWAWNKALLARLGPSHVMGLAVGNELDALPKMGNRSQLAPVTPECVEQMWAGKYFWETFTKTVAEFDALGFQAIPVTSVFGGAALEGAPFLDQPNARVKTFLEDAVQKYGTRFVFSFNFYPYFDANMHFGSGGNSCAGVLASTTCWKDGCFMAKMTEIARHRVTQIAPKNAIWLGETGWSSPFSPSVQSEASNCGSSAEGTAPLREFYGNFLQSDLAGVEHAFYFSVRDAKAFGEQEHFGLISTCGATQCKLQQQAANSTGEDEDKEAERGGWTTVGEGERCNGSLPPQYAILCKRGLYCKSNVRRPGSYGKCAKCTRDTCN